MNSANQMAEEIYGLHCDIGRLEKLVKHWKNEFIDEQDYAKMMELEADKAKAENVKLRELVSAYDSALHRLCDQMQGHVECSKCVLGRRFDEDTCALDELRKASLKLGVEVD